MNKEERVLMGNAEDASLQVGESDLILNPESMIILDARLNIPQLVQKFVIDKGYRFEKVDAHNYMLIHDDATKEEIRKMREEILNEQNV